MNPSGLYCQDQALNNFIVVNMSHEWPQFKLRIPPELKEGLQKQSSKKNRSLNSEIMLRLKMSLLTDSAWKSSLTAESARELAEHSKESIAGYFFDECISSIHKVAKSGVTQIAVPIPHFEDENTHDIILAPAVKNLQERGFKTEVVVDSLLISF